MAMIPMEYGGGKKVISDTATLTTSSSGTLTLSPVNYICAYVAITGGYYYPLSIYLYNNKYYAKGYITSSGNYVALTGSTTYTVLNYYFADD